jgi:hypothetical protein
MLDHVIEPASNTVLLDCSIRWVCCKVLEQLTHFSWAFPVTVLVVVNNAMVDISLFVTNEISALRPVG